MKYKYLFLLPVLFLFSMRSGAELVINELMQSNIDCIMDDLNEYPDSWVELYNSGEETVNLSTYKLGDSKKPGKAYQLPEREVAPGDYIIIYCDKEGKGYHTDFRLESSKGGNLYLFHDEEIVDKVESLAKMPAPNVAYGRKRDGTITWGYQLQPTPGEKNYGFVSDIFLGEPVFSTPGSVLTEPVILTLSIPEGTPGNAVIRYTTDGSEPTKKSSIYVSPIKIEESCVVKAKLFAANAISPRATTHSYIFHDRAMTIPIISISGDPSDFYSDEKGILSEFIGESGNENFMFDWRRPINFEYFETENKKAKLNQLCETRLKGSASRKEKIKSMVVYANKRFGTKRLDFVFFPDQKPDFTDFKSIELRNAGQDCNFTYMRDMVIQRVMGQHADLDWAASHPVVVYLNGEYHGMLNLRERSNEDNIYTNYDGLEDVDIIENWRDLSEGSMDEFIRFRDFYKEEGHSYDEYAEWMDIPEFANLFIMNIFFSNCDFPGANCIMWRPRKANGKWRWIAKDTDLGLGFLNQRYNYPTFNFLYEPDNYPQFGGVNTDIYTVLFRHLCETPEFLSEFSDRFVIYMGEFLNPQTTISVIDEIDQMRAAEYPRHKEKNVDSRYQGSYADFLGKMKQWVFDRYGYIADHMVEFYNLNPLTKLEVEFEEPFENLSFNKINLLNNDKWEGRYFVDKPLTITTDLDEDTMLRCKVTVVNDNGRQTFIVEDKEPSIIIPKEASEAYVAVSSFIPEAGISTPDLTGSTFDSSLPYKIYDVNGRQLQQDLNTLSPGVYIIIQGNRSIKIVR